MVLLERRWCDITRIWRLLNEPNDLEKQIRTAWQLGNEVRKGFIEAEHLERTECGGHGRNSVFAVFCCSSQFLFLPEFNLQLELNCCDGIK